jgi:hypothetical protein
MICVTLDFLPSGRTPLARMVHFLPSFSHRPSPKVPSESKVQERIFCWSGSQPTICVPLCSTTPSTARD